jgi:pimeloyl-ACP methyl ester carboxylesterase
MQPFGIHRQDHWRHLVLTGTRPAEGGGLRLHYDPGIAEAFVGSKIEDVSFWPVWDAIRCPVLALRGAQSDLLSSQVAKEMTERGPRCDLVEFPDCGHAPALMELDQIKVVDDWLAQGLASNGG